MREDQPIGIFDSGVGGLTVASAVKRILPNESIIYFGDTAHLPYGDKSKQTIVHYAEGVTRFLLEQQCKTIVIACNSASSNAYEEVKQIAGDDVQVINVIDPVINYFKHDDQVKKLSVIGTKSTIASGAYENRLKLVRPDLWVYSLATPLLVPMIEEGFIFDDISNAVIRSYLSNPAISDTQAIILGCTHYPIIKNQILRHFNFSVDVIDSAQTVAQTLQNMLSENKLLNTGHNPVNDRFIVSDYTDSFKTIAKMFFEKNIELETLNIWS
jgi:glutamate racemase